MTPDEKRGLNDYLAGYQSARSELREENAKLRELVRDMYGTYDQLDLCRLCSDVEACDFGLLDDRCSMRDRYLQRMRELGIEASE